MNSQKRNDERMSDVVIYAVRSISVLRLTHKFRRHKLRHAYNI